MKKVICYTVGGFNDKSVKVGSELHTILLAGKTFKKKNRMQNCQRQSKNRQHPSLCRHIIFFFHFPLVPCFLVQTIVWKICEGLRSTDVVSQFQRIAGAVHLTLEIVLLKCLSSGLSTATKPSTWTACWRLCLQSIMPMYPARTPENSESPLATTQQPFSSPAKTTSQVSPTASQVPPAARK